MLSKDLEQTLNDAFRGARAKRHEFMTVEHLLLALLDNNDAIRVLKACGADIGGLRGDLVEFVDATTPLIPEDEENPYLLGRVVYNGEGVLLDIETAPLAQMVTERGFALDASLDSSLASVRYEGDVYRTPIVSFDGDLSAGLQWISDLDGPIGVGGSLSVTTLSVGTHTVTAEVVDAGGAPAYRQVWAPCP